MNLFVDRSLNIKGLSYFIVFTFQVANAESDLQKKKELLKESEGSEVLKGDEV